MTKNIEPKSIELLLAEADELIRFNAWQHTSLKKECNAKCHPLEIKIQWAT